MMNRGSLRLAALSTAAWSTIALAQAPAPTPTTSDAEVADTSDTAVPDEGDIEAIIVTARKQNETLLDAPATISIVTSDALAAEGITSGNQLGGIVPGLVMTPGVAGLPGTTFRGLGSNTAIFSLESSVAQYIDGVYLGHARNYVTPYYDIDHIEFIKGTQSTLLGKNTSLGAISVVNKRPTGDFGYLVRLNHSWNIDANRAEVAVNLPLSETVQLRAAAFASEEQGQVFNDYKDRDEPRTRDLSGRLSLALQPSENIDGVLIYQHDRRRVRGQVLEVLVDPARVVANRAALFGQVLNIQQDYINGSGSDALGGATAGPDAFDRQDTDRLNAIVNFDLGGHTLTSQTAYVDWEAPRVTDLDFTAANLFNLVDEERNKVFSQELRISSPIGGAFSYLGGVYYYDNTYNYDRLFGASPTNTVGFPFTGGSSGQTELKTSTISAFVSGSLEVLEGLRLNAGARYTREKKEGTFVRTATGTLAGAFPPVPFTVYAPQITHPLDYDFGIQFEPNSDVMLYATHSKGSKSGGFQDFPTTAAGAPYTPETAYSTEAGLKWNLRGGSYFTAAIFNTEVKDFQVGFTRAIGTPPVSQTVIGNSDIRSRGFEANASARLSPNFRLGGSIVYADGEFTEAFPATAAVARKGDPLTRSPKWSGKLEGDYSQDMSNGLEVFAGASVDFASTALHQFVVPQPDAPKLSAHQLLDARIGVKDEQAGWEVALLGTNLTDEQYPVFATSISAGGTGIGNRAFYGSLNRPRVIAVQLTLRR